MISLTEMPANADGLLTRANPRTDGSGDIIWDIDVSFSCDSDDAAETVEGFVPGALHLWRAGSNGAKGSVKKVGGYELVRVEFSNQEGQRIASGHCDIRYCSFTVSGDVAMLTVRFRVHGMLRDPAASLIYKLDQIVSVKVESQQTKVFVEPSQEEQDQRPDSWDAYIGKLILFEYGQSVIAGILEELDGDRIVISTMEGKKVRFESERVALINSFYITSDKPSIPEAVAEYIAVADGIGSWDDYIVAFGELFAEGEIEAAGPDSPWEITDIVTARAVDVLARSRES